MKIWKTVAMTSLALMLVGCSAEKKEAPQAEAAKSSYGAEITVAETTPVADVLASPADYLGQTVLLEGKVGGRCQGSSCWISLDGNVNEGLIVRSADESFIFPEECDGKTVQVQGVVMMQDEEGKVHTEAEVHDHAEGEEGHECPNPRYFIEPQGMKIKA